MRKLLFVLFVLVAGSLLSTTLMAVPSVPNKALAQDMKEGDG